MMMKKMISCLAAATLVITAVPALAVTNPVKAYACSKSESTTPEYDYEVAKDVFTGTVLKVENVYFDGKPYRMATFVPGSSFKGGKFPAVITAPDGDRCGMTFEQGHTYLMYSDDRQGYPYVSISDVYEGDEAAARVDALKNKGDAPLPDPVVYPITLYPGHEVKMMLNNKPYPVSPAPVFYQNSLYVPITFFRDTLGYVTVWNTETQRYEITLKSDWAGIAAKGDEAQSQFNGYSQGIPDGTDAFTANVTYSNVQVKVNGRKYAPELQPFTYDGVVYVPLRDTAEKLGIQVKWDAATYTASMKDTRPIEQTERPVLVMKLSSNTEGEADIIVDRMDSDQVQFHYDKQLEYGQQHEQMTASFDELVKDRRLRLFLKAGDRENELVITGELMNKLLTDPYFRQRTAGSIGHDTFIWPDHRIIGVSNV
ncbi:stalk domain-containing protein [Paenibacillus hamazuiensis]|uniref:stalk domain-containing protein n=1 Tax=Paenibacillus hamazuiensis TaxID=2936508 RepID=UPI002010BC4E|nr:stalk domain-containing protein [Paenibacillus hamazuiensis]